MTGVLLFQASASLINTAGDTTMRICEIVDGASQQVNLLKLQAKTAQKRAKEAALRLKVRNAQQSLAKIGA
jgi:predicted amino acid dehydrogenase